MAEQKFYDTQPTGENTDVDYRDPTDVTEVEEEIQQGQIDPLAQKFALWIRTKMYRRHVREALARMMEWTSVLFNKIKAIAERTELRQTAVEEKQNEIEKRFNEQLAGNTDISEVVDARYSKSKKVQYDILGDRLEAIELSQLQRDARAIDTNIILCDENFLINHKFEKIGEVADSDFEGQYIYTEIGEGKTFHFEKVGDI